MVIHKYSNALHHAITSNILAMQNSYEYDDSTLVFVPRVIASSKHHAWLMNEKQSVVTGRAKGHKKSVFYDLDPWYEEKDAGSFKKTSKSVTDGVAGSKKNKAGIYYADLKKYIKNKEKKSSKNKKSFVEVTSNDSKEKYEVCKDDIKKRRKACGALIFLHKNNIRHKIRSTSQSWVLPSVFLCFQKNYFLYSIFMSNEYAFR